MNMKYFLMTAAIVVATSSMAMAMEQGMPMEGKDGKEQTFEERKAEMLKNMGEHVDGMQKKLACLQAAADREALQACFPHWKEHAEHMKEGMKEHMMKGRMMMKEHMGDHDGPEPEDASGK